MAQAPFQRGAHHQPHPGPLQNFYRRTLPRLLRHSGRVVSVGAVCFVAAILLMSQMEFVLMASNYDGSIMVDVSFRSGTKVEVMNERIQTLEDALLSDENFESVTLSISGTPPPSPPMRRTTAAAPARRR